MRRKKNELVRINNLTLTLTFICMVAVLSIAKGATYFYCQIPVWPQRAVVCDSSPCSYCKWDDENQPWVSWGQSSGAPASNLTVCNGTSSTSTDCEVLSYMDGYVCKINGACVNGFCSGGTVNDENSALESNAFPVSDNSCSGS